jgi:hypothetical protein
LLLGGCFCTTHVRKFEERGGKQAFEDWRVWVTAYASPVQPWENREETLANHQYELYCGAATVDYGSAANEPGWESKSRYRASISSFVLTYQRDGQRVTLETPPMKLSIWSGSTRMGPQGVVLISPEVKELEAEVTITFTPKGGGEPVVQTFHFTLVKFDGNRLEPVTV